VNALLCLVVAALLYGVLTAYDLASPLHAALTGVVFAGLLWLAIREPWATGREREW
jgi:hypothetical protein